MAIAFTNLGLSTGTADQPPDIRNVTDATSFTIASWDPPNDGIVLLCIQNSNNAGSIAISTVTGNGDFWSWIADNQYSGSPATRQLSIYAAYGVDLITGATVIDFGANTQINCYVSIFHVTGADESGVVDTSPWEFSNAQLDLGTSTGATILFNNPANSNNRGIAFIAHNANEVVSEDTTWTNMDDMNGAGPAMGMLTAVDESGLSDPTFSWTTSADFGLIGMEMKAAVAAPAVQRINLVRSTQRW